MSSNKKTLLRTVFTANGSCGCGKTKAIEVHEPTPKAKMSIHHHLKTNPPSSSKASSSTTTSGERNGALSVDDDDFSSSISEPETTTAPKRSPLVDSVAIEKDSEDPYHDFRHSMLQMIFEMEIHSEDDLQDLLHCFLQLNAPCYHHVIVKAFNDICQKAFPDKVSLNTTPATILPSPSNTNHITLQKTH